ncbi:MAG TPA: chemotaxis protein CheD, partial [Burkholderiaceae bacterium]|nr:chemotaxis protein CheD [Burkholderiaceae bacterium]
MKSEPKPTNIVLNPGEYFVGGANCRISTLLGSCVSISLWHPVKKIGGLSHFLLSSRGGGKSSELDARYGEEVMLLMLADLKQLGVNASDCQGKIFGGGNMFPAQVTAGMPNVGKRNGETARSLLHTHGISIVSESLYGVGHRQIIFDVNTGNVWVRQNKLKPAQ